MSPDHPLAGRDHLEPRDFADQAIVVFDRSRSDLFTLALIPAGVLPRRVTDVPVTEALLELVRAGVAIGALASWAAAPDLEQGRLQAVRIGRRGLHRTWWAVLSSREPPAAPVVGFLEVLRGARPNRPAPKEGAASTTRRVAGLARPSRGRSRPYRPPSGG